MENIPVFKAKKGISPVWTLPVIALCICIWVVYTSIQNAGISVAIYFEDASGITPGKTQVIARGIPIGTVSKIVPDLSNRRIKTMVKMDKSVSDQLVEDTLFWVVRPEVSAASVQGLDTLFSGSYIGIQAGSSTNPTRSFIGLSSPPPISEDTPGLHIKLRATELGSIQNGSEVYYRNIAIGSVTKHSLEQSNDSVIINLFIKPEFTHLVRSGSRFCNASGISVSGKLTNLKVQVESLASLLKGGIVLHTPEALMNTEPAQNGLVFPLYKDLESARYGINMTLQLASSIGITEGETKVIYRGLVAGVVEKIKFNDDDRHTVTAHIMLDPRAERILRKGTQFWIVKPQISSDGIENLDIILTGPYITFSPGSGPYQDHFEIQPEIPPQKPLRRGSELMLTASESFSIYRGAPVTYKKKKVGEVLDVELDENYKNFEIFIFIYERYEKLVKPHSVFWSDGGVSLNASLSGIKVKSSSLSAAFNGGIAFVTPPIAAPAKTDPNVVFMVYENYEKAVEASPQLHPPGYTFQLQTSDPDTFKTGTPIFYKKINVGKITGFRLSKDNQTVLINCFIEKKYENTINNSSRFYDISGIVLDGSLSGVTLETGPLEAIVTGGISYITPNPNAKKGKSAVFSLYPNKKAALNRDRIPIEVSFKECENLRAGSPVKYKGVEIGEVKDLRFSDNKEEIIVQLLVEKEAEIFFRSNTDIWLGKAEVSFSGVKNLKTVLFGSFVSVLPGSGELQRTFTALTGPPSTPAETFGGLEIILLSKHLGSLKINSPIYYRQVKVGKVTDYRLSENFKNVQVLVNIDPEYQLLIRENTKFWVVSGAKIEGGLFSGISVTTESLEALITGGVALATPENSKMGAPVQQNHSFTLHDTLDKEWLDWQPDITLIEKEKHQKKDMGK